MRESGILLPVFSLPSPYGIGTFGKAAYDFVDFLHRAGQRIWQILPLGPTGIGNSPYQSFSTFAGNPYLIDLEQLIEEGWLQTEEVHSLDFGEDTGRVDYGKLYVNRPAVWQAVYRRFEKNPPTDFSAFEQSQAFWLDGYALFMALKEKYGGAPWHEWPSPLKECKGNYHYFDDKELSAAVRRQKMIQYFFFRQWGALKDYANRQKIDIVGDLPIYVSLDSADVWCHPELFDLDETLSPKEVAGCPPDGFSPKGQRWGNPLYDWEVHRQTDFAWWIERLRQACSLYNRVRIDHFRGLESYFAIPAEEETACNGRWHKGPGMALFDAASRTLGTLPIWAEDLGFLTPEVHQLLADSGFPGMRVMQFAFSDVAGDSLYLPHHFIRHCVAYAGTHDNSPILGWAEDAFDAEWEFARDYLHLSGRSTASEGMLRGLFSGVADTVIVQMQDWLGLGKEARINDPTASDGQWTWRMSAEALSTKLAEKAFCFTRLYRR